MCFSSETGAHQELPLVIRASEALCPSEELVAVNDESGNLSLSSNNGLNEPSKITKNVCHLSVFQS